MASRSYISRSGQVVRDRDYHLLRNLQYISWKRLYLLLIPTFALVITNPSNIDYALKKMLDHELQSSVVFSLIKPNSVFWTGGQRITNYGILSLEETFDSVGIHVLTHSLKCSFNDVDIGKLCDSLATKFCHQKPLLWDPNDRSHSAYRSICFLLIFSASFFFICPTYPLILQTRQNVLDGMVSIFYRPRLLSDLLFTNIAVHPALVEMNKVIPKLQKGSIFSTGNADFDFFIGIVFLLFVIGGGSNIVASRISGKYDVYGFSPVTAASLAYVQRITLIGRPILFSLGSGADRQPVTAAGVYWTNAASIIFFNQQADWFPRLLAWIIAGWAGSILAKYHLDNIVLLGGLLKAFGL